MVRMHMMRVALGVVVAGLLSVSPASALTADEKCAGTILKESNKYSQKLAKNFAKCQKDIQKGKIAGDTSCATVILDASSKYSIVKTGTKMDEKIAKLCPSVSTSVFPETCQEWTPAAACAGTDTTTASGISTCLQCQAQGGVGTLDALVNAGMVDPGADKVLAKCQETISKEIVGKNVVSQLKEYGKAAANVIKGKAQSRDLDAKAASKIAKANSKTSDKIAKMCGGPDKVFGGLVEDENGDSVPNDFLPSEIGILSTICPAFVTNEGQECAAPITSLEDAVDCYLCLNSFGAGCGGALGSPYAGQAPENCVSTIPAAPCSDSGYTLTVQKQSDAPELAGFIATISFPGSKIEITEVIDDLSAGGLFDSNATDTGSDGFEDELRIGNVALGGLPAGGAFATVNFSCRNGATAPVLSDFGCEADASTVNGDTAASCVLSLDVVPSPSGAFLDGSVNF